MLTSSLGECFIKWPLPGCYHDEGEGGRRLPPLRMGSSMQEDSWEYIYIGSRWCCWPLCPGWLRLGQCSEFLLRPPGEKSVLSCPVCEVAADTVQTPDSWSSVGLNIFWPSCLVSPPPLPILYLSFVLLPQDLALWCNWSDWLLGNKGLQTPALSTIPPAPARCVAGLCQILGILLPYCPPLGSEGLHGGALLPSGQVKDMSQSLVH